MSPWWNKFFQRPHDVLITSGEVVLSRDDTPIATAVLNPPAGSDTFEARMGQALKTVIDQAPGGNGRSANIWLGHSLVLHGVVEIDARAMSAADISAALKSYWEDTLDVAATTLSLAHQVQPHGRSIFSSCCNLALIETIQATLRRSGWTTSNIAPHLAKTWNEGRKQIHGKNCCLLVLQDKVLSIGVHQNGHWIAWTSEGCGNAEWAELAHRTTRFCRSTGLCDSKSMPVWIYAPQTLGTPRSAGLNNWSLLSAPPHAGLGA